MNTLTCLHCQEPCSEIRGRGLCGRCHRTPEIRDSYRLAYNLADIVKDFCGNAPAPSAPTACLPGTAAKVAELCERARAGNSLWHPDDSSGPVQSCADRRSELRMPAVRRYRGRIKSIDTREELSGWDTPDFQYGSDHG